MPVIGTATIAIRTRQEPPVPGPQPGMPWRHQDLFREPVYADGEPYDRDDGGPESQ